MGDDDDKTVFGQSIPTPKKKPSGGQVVPPATPPPATPPAAQPAPPQQPSPGGRTVFGVQLPQSGTPAGGGRVAPTANPAPPRANDTPGVEDTWLGGSLNPGGAPASPGFPGQQQPPQQAWGQPQPPQQQQPQQSGYGQQPLYQPQGVPGTGAEMFPDIPQEQQQQVERVVPRIALEDALRGTGPGKGGSSNPLVAAAANLLILLGRLRTGLVEMQAGPLIDHVAREIDAYEKNVLDAGVNPQDASDAKYALAATADDIVQNLPGSDKGMWLQYSMVARFFGERSAGVVFFQKMDAAMKAPGQKFNLLELMGTCLSLGFEGQYRVAPNGSVDLARVRTAIYETLRRVQPRPDDDISVHWAGVPLGGRRRYGGVPIWIVASVAALMVVALFATLSTLMARQGAQVREGILAIHTGLPEQTIERTVPVEEPYVAPDSDQLATLREKLAVEIDEGLVTVDELNEFIFVRVGDALRFRSGSADLDEDFTPLATRIATALDTEPGPIRVVGHTDSIPPSGRGRYKTNEDLSLARAETVKGIMAGLLTDPDRLSAEGRGPADPIADNETREGRAKNRRVELLIVRGGGG